MRSLRLLPVALLAGCLLGGESAEAATTRRAGMRVNIPSSFRPVPGTHARRDAGEFVTLLQKAGLRASIATRARQDRAGSPTSPQATFTAARVRVLTPSLQAPPRLAHEDLLSALEEVTGRDPAPTLLEPRVRTVGGQKGVELGWTSTMADGRQLLQRFLLVPRQAEVLVLALRAFDADLARWEVAWAAAAQSLALEAAPASAAPFPWDQVAYGAAGLAFLLLLGWWRGLRRARARGA